MVPQREIGSADTSPEKDVTADEEALRGLAEGSMGMEAGARGISAFLIERGMTLKERESVGGTYSGPVRIGKTVVELRA